LNELTGRENLNEIYSHLDFYLYVRLIDVEHIFFNKNKAL